MRLVFLHIILLDRIRACFCGNEQNRIIKFTCWAIQDILSLFCPCVSLRCFSMFLYLIIGKFFFFTLEVIDVVKIINCIK